MKKILVVHNYLWTHYKAVVFTELYNTLKNNGYELLVLQIALKGVGQKAFGDVELDLHKYPFKLLFNEDYEASSSIKKSVVLLREIYKYRPDIVIQPGFAELPFWVSMIMAKVLRIPSILTCDSTAQDNPRNWAKDILKKIYVRNCDAGFVYGAKSKEYLINLGMNEKDIFIRHQAAPNNIIRSVYDELYAERNDRLEFYKLRLHNFIYTGRLVNIKNVSRLISAFHALKKSNPTSSNWGLIIVGDGPEKINLIKQCEHLGVADVNFFGGKSWREIPEFLALSDVLILPSISEPWGLVVNEAMVCGLPVIVSRVCGAADDIVLDGSNGFVFDPLNVHELQEKMDYFVNNPNEISRMGNRSVQIINNYSPVVAANQMINGIKYVLNDCSSN